MFAFELFIACLSQYKLTTLLFTSAFFRVHCFLNTLSKVWVINKYTQGSNDENWWRTLGVQGRILMLLLIAQLNSALLSWTLRDKGEMTWQYSASVMELCFQQLVWYVNMLKISVSLSCVVLKVFRFWTKNWVPTMLCKESMQYLKYFPLQILHLFYSFNLLNALLGIYHIQYLSLTHCICITNLHSLCFIGGETNTWTWCRRYVLLIL